MVCRKIQACIMSISEKDKRYVWHPFTQMKTSENALPIVRGEGTLLFDEDGNSYIDAIASWWVNLHGHAHPYLASKVSRQMQVLEHIPGLLITCVYVKIKGSPSSNQQSFFSGDGSSAIEIVLR